MAATRGRCNEGCWGATGSAGAIGDDVGFVAGSGEVAGMDFFPKIPLRNERSNIYFSNRLG